MKNYCSLIFLTLLSPLLFGQNIPEDLKPPSWKNNNAFTENIKPYKLPSFDIQKLIEEDKLNDKNKSKPWRFGKAFHVGHDINTFGEWTQLENGDQVWRILYTSEGALSLNFLFDSFFLPEGSKLYIYNYQKNDLLRPFTHFNNNEEETLGTWLVHGDTAWIEYYQPAYVLGSPKIIIGSVIHGYRSADTYQKDLNDSGACNQDVDCDITPPSDPFNLDSIKDEVKKAVAMLVTGGGNGFCTGTLVNNTNNDGTPYILTANHCGGNEANWAFRFNWRSPNPSCSTNTPSPNGSFNQTVSGAILRANSSQSDSELVEITDTSFFNNNPDVVWAGWNRSTATTPVVNFGIHHPRGDIQKVSRDDDGAFRQVVPFNGNPNTQMWFIDQWELGVTEPSSSGSALFNENGHVIGVLSGGNAACNGTANNGGVDFYGRFDVAWDFGSSPSSRLREWLDPGNTGFTTLDLLDQSLALDVDAIVSSGTNASEICNEDFTPQITLTNQGATTLTSADISYFLDSETPTIINWTGNLVNGNSIVVATPIYSNIPSGAHTFTVSVSNPNATQDENLQNNTSVFNFQVSPSYETEQIILNINTDLFGEETTWSLADENGTIVASGPEVPYNNQSTFQENITIPNLGSCYTFTIIDSAGDGICCSFGNGSYSLEDSSGTTIISGGEFESIESITFKVDDNLSADEEGLKSKVMIFPNPTSQFLNISIPLFNKMVKYEIFNTIGEIVLSGQLNIEREHNSISVAHLNTGVYFLKLKIGKNNLVKSFIRD